MFIVCDKNDVVKYITKNRPKFVEQGIEINHPRGYPIIIGDMDESSSNIYESDIEIPAEGFIGDMYTWNGNSFRKRRAFKISEDENLRSNPITKLE